MLLHAISLTNYLPYVVPRASSVANCFLLMNMRFSVVSLSKSANNWFSDKLFQAANP